ncbi:MAG: hypothetical protein K1X67_18650 [Fimbriimonadaceae bacterium]|nr:hypothetical protein [Fimbriimonadaceae bacterium]
MKQRLFLRSLIALLTLATALAQAAIVDTVTFTSVDPNQTTTPTSGALRTHSFAATGYTLGRIEFSGNLQEVNGTTNDFGSDNMMRAVFPDGRFKDIGLTTAGGYSGVLNFSGSFYLVPGATPPYSGAWSFYFYNTFDDGPAGQRDVRINSIRIDLTDSLPLPPLGDDFGTIGTPGVLNFARNFPVGLVRWYIFTIGEATTGSKYLDIDTESTTGFGSGGFANDTVIALYSQYGELIASDDDDGSTRRSQLTFGPSAGTRPAVGDGVAYNGRDGSLEAGKTYYLAVCGIDGTFGDAFNASTNSISTGSIVVNIRTNVVAPPTLAGTVTLQDFGVSPAGQQVTVEVRPAGGSSPLQTTQVTLDAAGAYSFILSGSITPGTYDVVAKGSHWLRGRVANVAVTSTGATGVNFLLINGDVDEDNEVGIGDYAIISGTYNKCLGDLGYAAAADLNGDDCVDIADYAILSSNYGLIGED